MSISSFGLRRPAPALQAAVPPQIVKRQNVHAWTPSRAQQDVFWVKFLPPTSGRTESDTIALPMGAEDVAVQACPFAVQTCQKTHQNFPLDPPLKRSSAQVLRLRDKGDLHENGGLVDAHQGGAANDSFWGHYGEFSLPAHVVHGPSTELGPAGSHPADIRTSPLGLITILIANVVLFFVLVRVFAAAHGFTNIYTAVKLAARSITLCVHACAHVSNFSINSVHIVSRSVPSGNQASGGSSTNLQSQPGGGSLPAQNGGNHRRRPQQPVQMSNIAHGNDAGIATTQNTAGAEIKVMYWNIFHHFTLKLTSTEFIALLMPYHIMFFAETDMLPGEEDTVDVPPDYILLSHPRNHF
ncbi:hypothetical protein C8J57DRAFT_1507759 [Mycena rebaudengoi]|nr:hypothetical protein C8J57DRAFT_1507759 [Mycena rebaudengoi]